MKQLFKSTAFIAAMIILFVVIITGVCVLAGTLRHDEPEVLYNFAVSAIDIQGMIEDTNLLSNIEVLLTAISEGAIEDTEINNMIQHGLSAARVYKKTYYEMTPTDDTLVLYKSLVKEGTLINSCYVSLNSAWSARQADDFTACNEYLDDARKQYEEVINLRAQNRAELDNMQSEAELEMREEGD